MLLGGGSLGLDDGDWRVKYPKVIPALPPIPMYSFLSQLSIAFTKRNLAHKTLLLFIY